MKENTITLRNNRQLSYSPNISNLDEEIGNLKVFLDNLEIILGAQEMIFSESELFFTPIELRVGVCYITSCPDSNATAIGNYLETWEYDPESTTCCPICNSKSYIFTFAGSPLSGTHSFHAYCINCQKSFKGEKAHFSDLWSPFVAQLKRYPSYNDIKHFPLSELIKNIISM